MKLWIQAGMCEGLQSEAHPESCEPTALQAVVGSVSVPADTNATASPTTTTTTTTTTPDPNCASQNRFSSSGKNTDEQALRGILLEVQLNQEIAGSMLCDLGNLLHGNGRIPLRRLLENATAGFMQYPFVPLSDPIINLCWFYLQEVTMFNRLVDSIDNPTAPDDFRTVRIKQALAFRERLEDSSSKLLTAIENKVKTVT